MNSDLQGLMDAAAGPLGQGLGAATVLALMVWGFTALAPRAPAVLRQALWRGVLAAFWLAPLAVFGADALHLPTLAVTSPVPVADPAQTVTDLSSPPPVQTVIPVPPEAERPSQPIESLIPHPASQPLIPHPPPRVPLSVLLLALWLGGAGLGGLALLRDLWSVRRLRHTTRPLAAPALSERVAHWTARLGLRRPVRLAESEAVGVPVLVGLWRPALLLPPGFAARTDAAAREAALVHELAHLRQGDLGTLALARLTCVLLWWHPLVWLTAARLRVTAEEVCDDWAVALTATRQGYAEALVQLAEAATVSAGSLACVRHGRSLVRRVQRILSETHPPVVRISGRIRLVLAVGAAALLVVIGVLRLTARPPASAAFPEATPPPFAPPANGLASRLISDRARYEEGQNVWLYLDVLNVSDQPIKVAWGSALEPRLRLTEGQGKLLKVARPIDPNNVGVAAISPGKQRQLLVFYVSGNPYARYAPLKPGRYQAVWPSQGQQTIQGARLPPESNTVTFEVVPRSKPPEAPGARVSDVPYGEPKGGLQTRLRAKRNQFIAGTPIPISVELQNVGRKTLPYTQPQVAINGQIEVLDSVGQPVPYLYGSAQTMNPSLSLRPNQTAVLDAVDLSEYYFLGRPGKYTARYPGCRAWRVRYSDESDIPSSNTFPFEVLPAEVPDPFLEALGLLLANRPPEWHVVSSPPVSCLEQPGSQWSRVPCRRVRFEHQDMYRDNRLDQLQILPVTLWLAREKAVEEPWELNKGEPAEPTEYLGKSPFGHLYMATPHETALKHWPTVRDDVMKWLKVKAE